ncbi:hypothetical protein BDN72DRAFT_867119 [Pluteus cervinus]|uniref:Uncharacterized protein n=1 Tax=Pluteus cervinus TaxID=181527 RepID=A0ACD3BHY8_9AGAR|nr:hypothetical protein BDN72DRAFT_867119 [Pluteus cervinus]
MSDGKTSTQHRVWWSNSVFFVGIHLLAVIGLYHYPFYAVPRATLLLGFCVWQLADFGITIGYHRLYSHRSFRAKLVVRVAVAALGSAAFQGSIKWWCLRHRLHHRFTDDPEHDPYSATRGLFYSHMGWIFFKPKYGRLNLIEKDDLENDPVVYYQHKYYVPLAAFFGFILPPLIGSLWNDASGAFVWGGLVAHLAIWHCTFLVNSLAHWEGLQPYSDEDTSRGNMILALLTGGEGNHNFHAFPHDYRSGPSKLDWDPSKWIIVAMHHLGLIHGLRRAREDDMHDAVDFMLRKRQNHTPYDVVVDEWQGPTWDATRLQEYTGNKSYQCLIIIDDFVVDASSYLGEHPGGSALLRKYSIRKGDGDASGCSSRPAMDASWAFNGGLNVHSRLARRRMRELVVARYTA